jgi:hypothetical protein
MSRYQSELEAHVEKYAGPIEFRFENLLLVSATPRRHCHLVVTTNLSDQPMPSPKDEWRWAELCAQLPQDWPLDPAQWQDNIEFGWPMRELQRVVRFVRDSNVWVGFGHSIPNGNPAQPLSPTTKQCCSFLLPPLEMPEQFTRHRLEDEEILNFWAIVPIYPDELAMKINQKAPTLIERMGIRKVSDIIDPTRPSVFEKSKEKKSLRKRILGI